MSVVQIIVIHENEIFTWIHADKENNIFYPLTNIYNVLLADAEYGACF